MPFSKLPLLALALGSGLVLATVISTPQTFRSLPGFSNLAAIAGVDLPAITNITVPATWPQTTSQTITWQSTGDIPKVDILVCVQGGSCFATQKKGIGNSSQNQTSIYIGTNIPVGSQAYVKIRQSDKSSVYADSSRFEVKNTVVAPPEDPVVPEDDDEEEEDKDTPGRITRVGAPATWPQTTSQTITWQSVGDIPKVDILICIDGGSCLATNKRGIANKPQNETTIYIGTNIAIGSTVYVKVRQSDKPSVYLDSSKIRVSSIPIVIPEFSARYSSIYNIPNYPYLGYPLVTWTGITGPADTRCVIRDTLGGDGNGISFNAKDRPFGAEMISSNRDRQRSITLTCSSQSTSQVTKGIMIPPSDGAPPDGTVGVSSVPLSITSLTVTPANRAAGVPGSLAWSASCDLLGNVGCTCELFLSVNFYTTLTNLVTSRQGTIGSAQLVNQTGASVLNTKRTLVCVTSDGRKRVIRSMTDPIGGGIVTPPPTPIPGAPGIPSFTITPSTRGYNESARFSWTSQNADYCMLSTQGDLHMAPQSTGANIDRLTIPGLSTAPSRTSSVLYTLTCARDQAYSPTAIRTVRLTTTPTETPVPPEFTNGARPLGFGGNDPNDPYTQYNLGAPLLDTPQLRVRVAERVPIFSNGTMFPTLAEAETKKVATNLWGEFFKLLKDSFVPSSVLAQEDASTDLLEDGRLEPCEGQDCGADAHPLEVPYWADIEAQWQFANQTLPDTQQVNFVERSGISSKSLCDVSAGRFLTSSGQDTFAFANHLTSLVYANGWSATSTSWNRKTLFTSSSCQDQHTGGEWKWEQTSEEPYSYINQASYNWAPKNATKPGLQNYFQATANPYPPQKRVRIEGKKCEVPFETIIGKLNAHQPVDITENEFEEWGDTDSFDRFSGKCNGEEEYLNPEKCNSGDKEDIQINLLARQCVVAPPIDSSMVETALTVRSYLENYLNQGYPTTLTYALFSNVDQSHYGYHSVIALSLSRTGSGSDVRYSIEVLDPNGPTLETIECENEQIQFSPGVFSTVLACVSPSSNYSDHYILLLNRSVGYSPLYANIDSLISNKIRNDVAVWLRENYPRIDNGESWASPGICSGWTDFVLRVAYLGKFVGECPRPTRDYL